MGLESTMSSATIPFVAMGDFNSAPSFAKGYQTSKSNENAVDIRGRLHLLPPRIHELGREDEREVKVCLLGVADLLPRRPQTSRPNCCPAEAGANCGSAPLFGVGLVKQPTGLDT